MTQNLNSLYFQPFVFFTAAAVIYVVVAFVLDFLFRGDRARPRHAAEGTPRPGRDGAAPAPRRG